MATRNERKRRAKIRKGELEAAVDEAFKAEAQRQAESEQHKRALQELSMIRAGSSNRGETVIARYGPIVRVSPVKNT